MTAGRGIVHCEMPDSEEPSHGLQLWVNLAKEHKMTEPAYQELKCTDIPKVGKDGVEVKVIAGESFDTKVYPILKMITFNFILIYCERSTLTVDRLSRASVSLLFTILQI